MDQQHRVFEQDQASHVERETSHSPDVPGEADMVFSEVQLFQRITRWTLLLGVMIGCWLTLCGIEMFGTQLHISLSVEAQFIGPLTFVSMGAIFILQWRVQRLRSQLPALRKNTKGSFQRLSGLMGFAIIAIGSFALIAQYLPSAVAQTMISVGGVGLLILICSIDLYLTIRSNHQGTKRE